MATGYYGGGWSYNLSDYIMYSTSRSRQLVRGEREGKRKACSFKSLKKDKERESLLFLELLFLGKYIIQQYPTIGNTDSYNHTYIQNCRKWRF